MQKIPTVFLREEEGRRYVIPEVNPGCEWVLNGEGTPTRKYDGTCVMYDGEDWWSRREVKVGKPLPQDFRQVDFDPVTGKTVGWEPIENSSFYKFFQEAFDPLHNWDPGTYELIGPKVNGNPEHVRQHMLWPHEEAETLSEFTVSGQRDFQTIRATVEVYAASGYEGIVYHHPDGRMAKIKARDFPKREES